MTKNAEKNARTMLSRLSTEQLIKEFDMTEAIPISLELSMVRGWIMDELEKRNPEAFDKWLDLDYPDNESLKKYYYLLYLQQSLPQVSQLITLSHISR